MALPVLMKGWTDPITFSGPPPAVATEQLALFPRKTRFEYPAPDGKDITSFVQADNGLNYYLKIDKGEKTVRANEWLSYQIARIVGVLVPKCDFIQTNNGDIAFGSEAVTGAAGQAETVYYLERYTMLEFGSSAPGLQAALSSAHALDLFLNNVDRHQGNFLVVGEGDERRLLSMDFARSIFWRWPWNGFFGFDETSGTAWADMRQRHGFDLNSALTVVNRLGLIKADDISRLMDQMPTHWLGDGSRNDLLTYCRNGGWAARVATLRKGLVDGSII